VVFCCPIIEGYGQTESTVASFFTDIDDNASGYVGGCTSMNEFKLEDIPEMEYLSTDKDEKGNPIPRGEVCIKGPSVIRGYFN
jgi:long-chain acyl-CoA synthetase